MKIVVPGGSGHVGRMVRSCLEPKGWEVVVLSRHPDTARGELSWDGANIGSWLQEMEGADVVLNLAGQSVNCRYTPENLKKMTESRVRSTRVVGQAIAQCKRPPRVWLQSSSATLYAHRFDAPNDEPTGIIGGQEPEAPPKWTASVNIVKAWEKELDDAETPNTRKVALRSAMTMSVEEGSVFDVFSILARRGLMGTAGSGKQFVSWIHGRDFVRAVEFMIEREDLAGPIDLCAPNPLPNADFNRCVRNAVGAKIGFPSPNWALEIGAWLMKTETELILKSRRVVPTRLLSAGFQFDFPTWSEAAQDLASRIRSNRISVCVAR